MRLGTIIFDDTTDYSAVVTKLNNRIRELVAIECSCNCSNSTEKDILQESLFYLRVAQLNLDVEDEERYKDCVKQAYYELVKLDC